MDNCGSVEAADYEGLAELVLPKKTVTFQWAVLIARDHHSRAFRMAAGGNFRDSSGDIRLLVTPDVVYA